MNGRESTMTEVPKNSHVTYSPVQASPFNKNRYATDQGYLAVFFAVLAAWAIACSIVLIGGGDDDSKYPTSILFSNKVGDLNDLDIYSRVRRQQSIYFLRFDEIVDGIERNISLMFDTWGITVLSLCVFLGGGIILNYLILIRSIPKICTWVAISCMVIGIILILVVEIIEVVNRKLFGLRDIWTFSYLNVTCIILIFSLISISRVGVKIIAQYIQKSCRVMFEYPSLFFFGICLLILDFLIMVITIVGISYQNYYDGLSFVMKLGSLYMRNFIYYFGIMVISQVIAMHHVAEDEKNVPKRPICHSIRIICRYHMGTVSLAATVILPFLVALFIVCKNTLHYAKTFMGSAIEICWKILVLFNISNFTLIITATHGLRFSQGTRKVFALTSKKSSLMLAFESVFIVLLIVGGLIALIVSAIASLAFLDSSHETMLIAIMQYLLLSMGTGTFLLLPVLLLAGSSADTTILYYLKGEEENEPQQKTVNIPLNSVESC